MPDAKGRALSASICLVAGSTSGTVWWTRLPMNRTPSSRPSPPVGEKVPGGRLRGIPTGSWPRCVILKSWRLSMNRASCGSQTRGPDRASVRRSGSWSQCMRKTKGGFPWTWWGERPREP